MATEAASPMGTHPLHSPRKWPWKFLDKGVLAVGWADPDWLLCLAVAVRALQAVEYAQSCSVWSSLLPIANWETWCSVSVIPSSLGPGGVDSH